LDEFGIRTFVILLGYKFLILNLEIIYRNFSRKLEIYFTTTNRHCFYFINL